MGERQDICEECTDVQGGEERQAPVKQAEERQDICEECTDVQVGEDRQAPVKQAEERQDICEMYRRPRRGRATSPSEAGRGTTGYLCECTDVQGGEERQAPVKQAEERQDYCHDCTEEQG